VANSHERSIRVMLKLIRSSVSALVSKMTEVSMVVLMNAASSTTNKISMNNLYHRARSCRPLVQEKFNSFESLTNA